MAHRPHRRTHGTLSVQPRPALGDRVLRSAIVSMLMCLAIVVIPAAARAHTFRATPHGAWVGTITPMHGDLVGGGATAERGYFITGDGHVVPITGVNPRRYLGKRVLVHGSFARGRILVNQRGGARAPGITVLGPSRPLHHGRIATGSKTVLVILGRPSNVAAPTGNLSQASMTSRWFATGNATWSVRQRIRAMSNNDADITGTVTQWLNMGSGVAATCSMNWGPALLAAAQSAGINTSSYDYISYNFYFGTSCNPAGLGAAGGTSTWIFPTSGNDVEAIATHELGHNFGFAHANSATCVSGASVVPVSGACTPTEYGDEDDVMGSGCYINAPANAFERWVAGWQLTHTQTVAANGTFTLNASASFSGTTALRIKAPADPIWLEMNNELSNPDASNDYYFVEYQPATSMYGNASGGLFVRIGRINENGSWNYYSSKRYDLNGSSIGSALPVGGTFTDHSGGLAVTLNSQTGSAASVTVSFTNIAPSTPADLRATKHSSSAVYLAWSASTPHAPAIGAGYLVYRYNADGSGRTLVATTARTAKKATISGLTADTIYKFGVVAIDSNGVKSAETDLVTAGTDVTKPVAPTSLLATEGASSSAALTWGASTDNLGVVKYIVQRRSGTGAPVTIAEPSSSATDYTDTGLWPGTIYTYTVRALDAAGNSSIAALTTITLAGTLAVPPAPGAPSSTPISATKTTLSWSGMASASSYVVYRKNSLGNWAVLGETTGTSAILTIPTGVATEIALKARNAKGLSLVGPSITVTL